MANPDAHLDRLEDALAAGTVDEVRAALGALAHDDRVIALSRLEDRNAHRLLTILPPLEVSTLLREMPEGVDNRLVKTLSPEEAAPIFDHLRSDLQADLLGMMDSTESEAILDRMVSGEIKKTRFLLEQIPNTVGTLMVAEFLSYREDQLVREVLEDLRSNGVRYSDYEVQYAYISTPMGTLCGVLRMRDLLFASEDTRIGSIMLPSPMRLKASMPINEAVSFFEDHQFVGVPVVDDGDGIVGVVRRATVREAAEKDANKAFLALSGIIGGEELRSLPLRVRAGRRLAWLMLNIGLNIIAASVVAMYEETLTQVIALAVFLPIISDMSGCSGSQAVAVSIRELTLGLVRPREFLRVLGKESLVGIINGTILGLMLAGIAFAWKGNAWLGLVVGLALALNTLVAVVFGGLLPLIMKMLRLDPALVSSPLLTTVTDMCGFFLVLSIATALLPRLVGM